MKRLLIGASALALGLAFSGGARAGDQIIAGAGATAFSVIVQTSTDHLIEVEAKNADATLDSSTVLTDHAFQFIMGVQSIALQSGNNSSNAASDGIQVFTNQGDFDTTTQTIAEAGATAASAGTDWDQKSRNNDITVHSNAGFSAALLDSTMGIHLEAFKDIKGVQAIAIQSGNNSANAAGQYIQVFTNNRTPSFSTTAQRIAGVNADAVAEWLAGSNKNEIRVDTSTGAGDVLLDSSMFVTGRAFKNLDGVQAVALQSGNNSTNAAGGALQVYSNLANDGFQDIAIAGVALADFDLTQNNADNIIKVLTGDGLNGTALLNSTLLVNTNAFDTMMGVQQVALQTGNNSVNAAGGAVQVFTNMQ